MSADGRVHACGVNGHDAQYWYERFLDMQQQASAENLRGREQERRIWQRVTGCIDVRAYKDRTAIAPVGTGNPTQPRADD